MNFMSSLVPKCRHPVGHALMHAGSSPAPTLSEHSVHLYTFFVLGLNVGTLKVLPDSAIGRAGTQTSGIFAVHALMPAHEPREAAIVVLVLVKLYEVPVIPVSVRHRLVGVV